MTWAKPAFQWLAWLFLVGVGVQFFLAGLGLPMFGGDSIDPHKQFANVLSLITVLLVLTAILAKLGRPIWVMAVVLFFLVGLQHLWADQTLKPAWLRSFHVFDAFLIAGIAFHLAQRAGFPLKKSR